jgi:hypothetical protein
MTTQAYTAKAAVKTRLGITDTTDDTLLDTITGQVNSWLEGKIGFPVGPITSEERIFDGRAVRYCSEHGGYFIPCYPFGVRSVTAVRTSSDDGANYTTQTASDVLLRPHTFERETDWPAFELHIKSTATWSFETAGFDANGITATWGWAAIPDELKAIADKIAIAMYRGRAFGAGQQYAVAEDASLVAAEELSATDWRTIGKYQSLRSQIG